MQADETKLCLTLKTFDLQVKIPLVVCNLVHLIILLNDCAQDLLRFLARNKTQSLPHNKDIELDAATAKELKETNTFLPCIVNRN